MLFVFSTCWWWACRLKLYKDVPSIYRIYSDRGSITLITFKTWSRLRSTEVFNEIQWYISISRDSVLILCFTRFAKPFSLSQSLVNSNRIINQHTLLQPFPRRCFVMFDLDFSTSFADEEKKWSPYCCRWCIFTASAKCSGPMRSQVTVAFPDLSIQMNH